MNYRGQIYSYGNGWYAKLVHVDNEKETKLASSWTFTKRGAARWLKKEFTRHIFNIGDNTLKIEYGYQRQEFSFPKGKLLAKTPSLVRDSVLEQPELFKK
jgi:hypothetical protein